ncbi:hypothetical protein [Planotetraspora kaengkrachanensis]|uniref:Uncharacterized protein n=1 Tax=Planotetraspora kaengkrachanensis TaxID=575193 RepID=A0A8J3M3I0_9ACTN|nr:hypothetical protein [Planotetraspora kaengkrachanensis]GIG78381.1 hypothetical protein Pka01_15080 [Planotetraspora kaengkrachanensis]
MYSVETGDDASEQIAVLPKEGLLSFASLVDLLEIHPWSGDSYNRKRPYANMRTHAFGDHRQGLAIYLILEDQLRVVVLQVLWHG